MQSSEDLRVRQFLYTIAHRVAGSALRFPLEVGLPDVGTSLSVGVEGIACAPDLSEKIGRNAQMGSQGGTAMVDETGRDIGGRLAALEAQMQEVLALLTRLEAKMDRSLGLYDALGSIVAGVPARLVAALHSMTPAEHVALQMVLDNRSNREISVCLDVPEARVAEWVDSLIGKLDLSRRAEVRDLMRPVMARIPASEYERASGGLPKDWSDKYGVGGIPDPYRAIYHPN